MLYIAIGILGATVMPHNLYLHSAIVQTRDFDRTHEGKREAIRYSVIDSTVALTFALLVNAAIFIVSAATFYRRGTVEDGDKSRRAPGQSSQPRSVHEFAHLAAVAGEHHQWKDSKAQLHA